MEVSEENKALAEEKKNQANQFFQKARYAEAIALYTEAIELNPSEATYYSNRAFAYIKTESFGYAIQDADKAIALDKTFVKAYYRRATANMALSKFKESLKDLKAVCKVVPNDKDAQKKLEECEKIVRKIAFEEAINSDKPKVIVSDTIDLNNFVVDPSYDGPMMEEESGQITLDFVKGMMERFKNQKIIHKRYAFQILLNARKLFLAMPTLIDIPFPENSKFTVCGDTHGQYYDLLNIFEINGLPSETNPYLFNGDFVDRGSFSVEVIFTLLAFKVLYPEHMHLTRGNHETDDMNKIYGFQGEVKAKYGDTMYEVFKETFCAMPIAARIGEKVFVVHGGLPSKDDVTLDDIRTLNRFLQPQGENLLTDLLWSDPQPIDGRSPSKRGVGFQFGPDITQAFLKKNNLDLVIRSHEVKDEGYVVEHDGKCITIFSAPNYCDQVGNKGAFITFEGSLKPKFTSFACVPHPNVRPLAYSSGFNFMGL